MEIRQSLYKYIVDPIVSRIESRIRHLQSLRPFELHDGSRWNDRAIIGEFCKFYPDARVVNRGKANQLVIGKSCHARGEFLVFDNGSIAVGDYSFVGSGSHIWSHESVTIGSHVLISHQVEIHDSNYHSLDSNIRHVEIHERFDDGQQMPNTQAACAPVVIEDDVWIGFRSTILKGVTIGEGAVVAACSVVTKNVRPFTLVAGNPAHLVRELPR